MRHNILYDDNQIGVGLGEHNVASCYRATPVSDTPSEAIVSSLWGLIHPECSKMAFDSLLLDGMVIFTEVVSSGHSTSYISKEILMSSL